MRTLTNAEEQIYLHHLDDRYDPETNGVPVILHRNESITKWSHARDLLTIVLMIDAGLRIGETVGLLIGDLYFNSLPKKMFTVRAEISKSKRNREIPVSARLHKCLQLYIAGPVRKDIELIDKRLITSRPDTNAFTARSIQYICKDTSNAALGWNVTPHTLRHTFATKMMKVTDIRTVQELLGHRSVNSTQIYTHVNDYDKRLAIEKLGDNL